MDMLRNGTNTKRYMLDHNLNAAIVKTPINACIVMKITRRRAENATNGKKTIANNEFDGH